ncbi:MAG: hypothetical protein A2350_08575 [Candidatus Raymondbacteria bacterium RifOxyB12_full_50_8]|nr:MAG: hypothetical protein A2350_08575 [Candidatus Raymondbacteria bacterium RifOxyB12_full_50_8]
MIEDIHFWIKKGITMAEGLSIGGLASGLDTNAIIDGLVNIERSRITRVETQKDNYNLTLSSWGDLSSKLSELSRKADTVNNAESFDKYSLTSSNEDIVTLEGLEGGSPGTFSIGVYQLAQSEKIMSNTYAKQNIALGLSGQFTVNRTKDAVAEDPAGTDVTITIEAGDTLRDLRDKINSAADIGISASIVKLSETEYSLIITSKDTGSGGTAYTETTGTVLRDLGILNTAGEKGNVSHKAESAANASGGDITAATLFSDIDAASASVNDTITIRGMDHNGNEIATRNFVIDDPASLTVNDLLKEIEKTFNGTVTATVENGKIMVTDKTTGKSALQVEITANNEGGGSLNFGGLMAVNTAGKNGILQVGQDAFFSVDGLYLQSYANKAEDTIEGVAVNLKKVDLAEKVTVTLDRDLDAVTANVQSFLDTVNGVMKYITEKSKVKVTQGDKEDPNASSTDKKDKTEKGPLSNDSTVSRLKNDLYNTMSKQLEELVGANYKSLASVGITTDRYTGEFTIDEEKFKKALANNYDNVKKLFVTRGTAEDSSFILGRSTENTSAGRYRIDVDARTVSKLDAKDNVIGTWNAELVGSVLTVKEDGPAKDLSVTVPSSGSTILTFSKGVTREMYDYVKGITDAYDGVVSVRQKNIQDRIDELDERIYDMNTKLEEYRQRLMKEYSDLEQSMSRIQSQSSQMMAALGG